MRTAPGARGGPGHASEARPGWQFRAVLPALVLVIALLGTLLAVSLASSAPKGSGHSPAYRYYQSIVARLGVGSMMSNAYGWMTGSSGYAWMLGGADAPEWMRGESLPDFMMGDESDPSTVMGRLFAAAPGPRVSRAKADALGAAAPPGAVVDHRAKRLIFSGDSVRLTVLASPSKPEGYFRIANMIDPTVVIAAGARVTINFINADPDMAHGIVVSPWGDGASWMPMMTAGPAFGGAALWFLGEATSAGMHEGTLHFTASTPGTYQYLCPVPGHAQEGLVGTLIVSSPR